MKKKIIFLIFMVTALIIFSVGVLAAPSGTVDIFPNLAKVVIDGEKVNVQTLIFQDKVYIAARDLSNILGVKISWDDKSSTVSLVGIAKLKESKPPLIQAFLYIISRALQLAGIVLLIQAAFFRTKKDYYFVKKYSSSQTSLRRLAHTAGTIRMGVYYIGIGTIITLFVVRESLSYKISIPFILVLSIIFWFLGLGAANTTTRQNNALEENDSHSYE